MNTYFISFTVQYYDGSIAYFNMRRNCVKLTYEVIQEWENYLTDISPSDSTVTIINIIKLDE